MFINFIKAVKSSSKKIDQEILTAPIPIKFSREINYSKKKLTRFNNFVEWKNSEIAPTFPYALSTPFQLAIVTHKNFPFAPFGLVHKKEVIEVISPLKEGQWQMQAVVDSYRKVDGGYEVDFITTLYINGELAWKSTSTAFKKYGSRSKKIKRHKEQRIISDIKWNIPNWHGLKYGLISLNIDPIHISNPTARLMGHKSAIMHGMWTVARGLSSYSKLSYPCTITCKFISPIYLPSQVQYLEHETGFTVFNQDGLRPHVQVEII